MKRSLVVSTLTLFLQLTSIAATLECRTAPASPNDPSNLSLGPSCQELDSRFPFIGNLLFPFQDNRIICPFLRMMARADAIEFVEFGEVRGATINSVIGSALELGCGTDACGPVAGIVSAVQQSVSQGNPDVDRIDFRRLHDAPGVSHDCGLTFSLGATEVDDTTRFNTLIRLLDLSDDAGRLTFFDLLTVKSEACKRDFDLSVAHPDLPVKNSGQRRRRHPHSRRGRHHQRLVKSEACKRDFDESIAHPDLPVKNVANAAAGTLIPGEVDIIEMALIFGYLGGVDNGYVTFDDVYRFLNARLPEQKTKFVIDNALSAEIMAIPEPPCVQAGFFGISSANTIEPRLPNAFTAEYCQSVCRDNPDCNAWNFRNFWHPTDPFTCHLGTAANSRFTADAAHIGCPARDCRICAENGVTALSNDAREELTGGAMAASRDGADGSSSGVNVDGPSVAIGVGAGAVAVLLVTGGAMTTSRDGADGSSSGVNVDGPSVAIGVGAGAVAVLLGVGAVALAKRKRGNKSTSGEGSSPSTEKADIESGDGSSGEQ